MKTIPQYLHLGLKTYKTRKLAKDDYSIWLCNDICSLKYLGEWTRQQLIRCCEYGELL